MTDHSSQSNLKNWKTANHDIDWTISFDTRTISGYVILYLENVEETATVCLDTRDLSIESAKLLSNTTEENAKSQELKFVLHQPDSFKGSRLEIALPGQASVGSVVRVQVNYSTSPQCSALQWLAPEQTSGKHLPYLFSQCQAIHARSLLPCQDSPGVKATYSAVVRADSRLEVLMSAARMGSEPDNESAYRLHRFRQSVPIPSYLIALVSGHLVSRPLSDRCAVWSEPEMIDDSHWEFQETEDMLQAGESLCGPYRWGRYDLLVLPPSFPYGGMENPCLTFVTPTLLAGDRSLASVVAHEIAHSWTGNLVTNATWEDFWLNEGHTVYVERLVCEKLYGSPDRHLAMLEGWHALRDAVLVARKPDDPLTCLVPKLDGVDPDDAFSSVPYEKGSSLLYYIETLVGKDAMLGWLRAYVDEFAGRALNTEQWCSFLLDFMAKKSPEGLAKIQANVDWEAWFNKPGLPPVSIPDGLDRSLADACTQLAKDWLDDARQDLSGFTADAFAQLSTKQKILMLDELLHCEQPLPHAKLARMAQIYSLQAVKCSEVKFRWLRLAAKHRYPDAVDEGLKFLATVGRMKFVRPLYRELFSWPAAKAKAEEHFKSRRQFMHPITAEMVARDLAKA
ncbi:hypothetical protein BOX15_Mlig009299g2 [Macrostomum lignano]|uniref:Leuk-A4-hydro_C domain-containing protein n=2 Tax=Macrostomum lignano TaxID=282301 RepID=A0A1I8GFQ7_9PLAT|nr:hypothetical protein BOX15_Mlig009299g2 [Macrostomum lignano]